MLSKPFNFLTFRGIKIGADASFLFIALFLTWTLAAGYFPFHYPDLSNGTYWLMGLAGMFGLFVCIVLHELGHALVAKYYELPITQITLFILGGVAEIKKEPQSAKIEFLMAIAGPIVSLVLALAMYGLTLFGEQHEWPFQLTGVTGYLAMINLVIVIFNMIPAFPLDGGRIFRSILWGWKKNLAWATHVAAGMGAIFGLFLIFWGIFTSFGGNFLSGLWMVILGLFLRRAATASETDFYVGKELEKEKVSKYMVKNPVVVPEIISLKEFIDQYVYTSHHHFYPVVNNNELVGTIGLNEVKTIPQDQWEKTTVRNAMVPLSNLQTVSPSMNALEALRLMQESEAPFLLVTEGSSLVGLLTAQDLFKIIALKLDLEDQSRF